MLILELDILFLVRNSRSLSKPDIFNPTSKTLRAPADNNRGLQLAPFNHTGTSAKIKIISFYADKNLNTKEFSQEIKDRLGHANNASYKLEQPLHSLDNT